MKAVRIFISSVQKELELERAALASSISTDPFLLRPASKPWLAALNERPTFDRRFVRIDR